MSIYPLAKNVSDIIDKLNVDISNDNAKKLTIKEEIKKFIMDVLCPSILSLCERMGALVDEEIKNEVGKPLPTMRKKGPPGPPPKSLITINQMRGLYTALEVLWMWGMCIYTEKVTNIVLPIDGVHPTSLMIDRKNIMRISSLPISFENIPKLIH